MAAISGGEYRANIQILQFGREDLPAEFSANEFAEPPSGEGARVYNCFECVPIRVKPAADLDATSGEVSMAEVDESNIPVVMAEVTMLPKNEVEVGEDKAQQVIDFVDSLEEHDDVQKVHSNFNIPDSVLAKLQ